MNEYILSMNHISKSFPGVKALNDVSLHVKKGSVHALMGENGAGKSTTIKMLTGIIHPTSGEIFLEDVNIADPKNNINLHRQKMGMVFQQFNLFPHLTVLENIMLAPVTIAKKNIAKLIILISQVLQHIQSL